MNGMVVGGALGVLALFVLGCTPEARQDYGEAGQTAGRAAQQAGQAASKDAEATAETIDRHVDVKAPEGDAADLAMTGKVKSALMADKAVDAMQIDVDTAKRIIHLKGTVDSMAEMKRAEQVARAQAGAEFTVMNELQVPATGRTAP